MIEVTLVSEPAAGEGCYRSRIEDGEPDHILRLDGDAWDELGRPDAIVVIIDVLR